MTINDIATNWAEKPCLFRFPCVSTTACTHCKDAFTFWNGRRHCDFCGYIFHRDCTTKCKIDGEFFRRRICIHCEFYRNTAGERLREGGEFTCYRKGKPTAVTISLSEERGELDFVWLSHGVQESLSLQCVEVQKGFSHGGHMRTADYDPLKSLSLLVRTGKLVTTVDLRAPSAWLCQLWVDGLTAAQYIHQRVLEQASALQLYDSRGDRVHKSDSWFRINYLPTADRNQRRQRGRTIGGHKKFATLEFSSRRSSRGATRSVSESPSEADNEDFVEIELPSDMSSPSSHVTSPSSHVTSPSPTQAHPSSATTPVHVPVRSSSTVDRSMIQSTPGLPYLQPPLSSACSCHAYEIAPPRSFDPATLESNSTSASDRGGNSRKCCRRCRLTCRIVDLSNIV